MVRLHFIRVHRETGSTSVDYHDTGTHDMEKAVAILCGWNAWPNWYYVLTGIERVR